MTDKLPIAIVIPHAGLDIPPELKERIALTEEHIFNEADAYVDLIYDYRDRVLHWVSFPYARGILDVNRPADPGLHHRIGDGVVKRQTSYGDPVFLPEHEPDAALEQQLIESYWQTWHEQLAAIAADKRVKLVLDCHSMAALGPSTYDDPAQLRPRVTASNMGDIEGNPRPNSDFISASPALTIKLAEQLGSSLADIPALAPTGKAFDVNRPFRGGWDIFVHGRKQQPWIMIELSRALYIGEQDANTPIVPPDEVCIALLRERIWSVIEAIVAEMV
jgi:N-formylglutamate amidohydrolase